MNLRLSILFTVLMLLTASIVCADTPSQPCAFIDKASVPKINGKPDDAIWKKMTPSAEFMDNNGNFVPKYGATFKSATDGTHLYLLIELLDPNPSELPKENLGKDKIAWAEDVEIFIAPRMEHADYFQFAVDAAGSDADLKGLGNPIDFNCSWEHAESVHSKGWIAEMSIPLTELGLVQGVKPGDLLAFNICRSTRGDVKLQCWSPTFGGFNNRWAFGTLVIGGYKPASQEQLKELSARLEGLKKNPLKSVKSRAAVLGNEMQALQKSAAQIDSNAAWTGFVAQCKQLDRKISIAALAEKDLWIWSVDPWSLPWSETLPSPNAEGVDTIKIRAFRGEYITKAFAITNATEDVVSFRCLATDLITQRWTERALAADHIRLAQAQEVGLRGGGRKRDPLPELQLESVVHLAPGMNTLVWLTLDTRELSPGTWNSIIIIKPTIDTKQLKKIKLELEVLPTEFPVGPEPYVCNWAHYTHPVCSLYPEKCKEDQKLHYTNVHTIPYGLNGLEGFELGEDGKPIGEPDFTGIDSFISTFGTKGQVYVINCFYEFMKWKFGAGYSEGSDSWKKIQRENFAWYVKKMREHFESKGMGVRDYAWYSADEPCSDEDAMNVVNFGKLLQEVDPEQQTFVTVFNRVELSALDLMAPYVSVWVPSMGLTEAQNAKIDGMNARKFSYSVITRAGHPYHSYRKDAWRALDRGYEGIGFWNYNDCGKDEGMSVWDDNDGPKSDYSVIYEGTHGPVTSVRWEAWRQGVQDYRLLTWYASLKGKSVTDKSTLAGEAVKEVLSSSNTSLADNFYKKIHDEVVNELASTGEISGSVLPKVRRLVCLTGNGGDIAENVFTAGSYTYNKFPEEFHEHCGVKEGDVYFQGKDAPDGPQSINKHDGLVTDGLLNYHHNYAICWSPGDIWTVTFDLKKNYSLSHLLTVVDSKRLVVSISKTGKEGSWVKIDEIADRENGPKAYEGSSLLDLKDISARYVKLDMFSEGKSIRLGEVRIFGWR